MSTRKLMTKRWILTSLRVVSTKVGPQSVRVASTKVGPQSVRVASTKVGPHVSFAAITKMIYMCNSYDCRFGVNVPSSPH